MNSSDVFTDFLFQCPKHKVLHCRKSPGVIYLKRLQNFSKDYYFLHPDMHTFQGQEMLVFLENFVLNE